MKWKDCLHSASPVNQYQRYSVYLRRMVGWRSVIWMYVHSWQSMKITLEIKLWDKWTSYASLRPSSSLDCTLKVAICQCTVFRQDRVQISTEDLAKGGIMIVCPSSLRPVRVNVPHPLQLEILSVETISTHSGARMCIIAIFRCPQHLATFCLSLVTI